MAGYLIAVTSKVAGVSQPVVLVGVDNRLYPDQATAIAAVAANVTAYQAAKGNAITNVVCLVNQTR
jgi:hypothetical protein